MVYLSMSLNFNISKGLGRLDHANAFRTIIPFSVWVLVKGIRFDSFQTINRMRFFFGSFTI